MCARLVTQRLPYRAATRGAPISKEHADSATIGFIDGATDWKGALSGVRKVVHLAARVHVINDTSSDPLAEFRRVNVEGTVNLARQAVDAGVTRFIYVSSVKVNGESTSNGRPFKAEDVPAPEDPYGVSKFEAEQALDGISKETGLEVVIVRPPLVYGPLVRGNFRVMMRWLGRGVPLPLASISDNRRSIIALDNLVDLLMRCIEHPAAANQTFLASDGDDLSTAELLKRLGSATGKKAKLFYLPRSVLKLGSQLIGKHDVYRRLCDSLQVDIEKTRKVLAWNPPISVDEGLRRLTGRA